MRTPPDALVGPVAVQALRTVNVDIVFLGVHGIHQRAGFTTPNMLEAETDQALIGTGGRLVVTADHTKWGVTGVSTIARLAAADTVISDAGLSEQARAFLGDEVREVLLAGSDDTHVATTPVGPPAVVPA
jgi:DeoR/GlpR family transcriptional regulator of sugar metabolism